MFRLHIGRRIEYCKSVDISVGGFSEKAAVRRQLVRVKSLLKAMISLGWLPRRIRPSSRRVFTAQQARKANRRDKKAARQGQMQRRLFLQHQKKDAIRYVLGLPPRATALYQFKRSTAIMDECFKLLEGMTASKLWTAYRNEATKRLSGDWQCSLAEDSLVCLLYTSPSPRD